MIIMFEFNDCLVRFSKDSAVLMLAPVIAGRPGRICSRSGRAVQPDTQPDI